MKSSAEAELLVDCFHTLFGQRAGVLDCLLSNHAELRIDGRIVLVGGLAFEHATRTELLPEIGVFRVVTIFGLFFGVEVIEIAEEFLETVHRRQMFVAVADVILTELSSGISEVLHKIRDTGVLRR